jgi:hypothetical protein
MIKGGAFPAAGWSTEKNGKNRASGTAADVPIFFQPSQPVSAAACDRLDSWKQIAVYLEREVRTVQRWGKREGLPVHRQFHVKSGTVYAFKHEVDAWLKSRSRAASAPPPERRYLNRFASWLNLTLLMALQIRTRSLFWLAGVAQNSYESHLVALFPQGPAKRVRGSAGFHVNQLDMRVRGETQQLGARELLPHHELVR